MLQLRAKRDPEKFPTLQLALLACVRLAEPIALTSICPDAYHLVQRFEVGDKDNAAFYAGLLISAFSLAESLTGMYWGGLSDKIGRKPVLLLGCVGTMLSMIAVGFATNIWVALLGRAIGGLLNGNIGVIQTMVGELVTKPEHEPRAYSVMPFVWSIGTIIGPVIGGMTADPSSPDGFPALFPADGIFGRFPYLLPNLICAGLLLLSIAAGYAFLEETHPDMQPRASLSDDTYISEETPLIAAADAVKFPPVDLRAETYGTFNGTNTPASNQWRSCNKSHDPPKPKIFTKRIIALITALSIFTYHSMTYDHLLPIFLETERPADLISISNSLFTTPGGLGLSLRTVGIIMSINGVIALFVQAIIFPFCAEKFGVFRLFVIVTILHPICYFIMPLLSLLQEGSAMFWGIFVALAIRNLLSILAYPVLLILIKEATPSSCVLGKVNGLAASAGAACRTVAPPIAGWLWTLGMKKGISGLAWYGSGIVAIFGAIQIMTIKRQKKTTSDEYEWKEYGRQRQVSRHLPEHESFIDSGSETERDSDSGSDTEVEQPYRGAY